MIDHVLDGKHEHHHRMVTPNNEVGLVEVNAALKRGAEGESIHKGGSAGREYAVEVEQASGESQTYI